MKGTIVQATMGVDDLREARSWTEKKLQAEQRELETVTRRKDLAAGIQDAETLAVAERFEKQHAEKVAVLQDKLAIQTRELEMGERELGEMKAELRRAMSGMPSGAPGAAGGEESLEDPLAEESGAKVRDEIDSLARNRARADRDAEAQAKLDEMKKKMGK